MEDGRRAPTRWRNEKWEANYSQVSFLRPHEDINVRHIAINSFESLQPLTLWRKPRRRLQFMRLGELKKKKLPSWSLQRGQGAARHSARLSIKANEADEGCCSWTQVEISLLAGMSAVLHCGFSWQGWQWSLRVRQGQPGGAKPSCHGVWFPTDWHESLAGLRSCTRHRTADAWARLVPWQPSKEGHNERIPWLTCTLKIGCGGIHFGIIIVQTKQIVVAMMVTEAQRSLMKLSWLPPELHFIHHHFGLFTPFSQMAFWKITVYSAKVALEPQ